jgi:hypothetical protein
MLEIDKHSTRIALVMQRSGIEQNLVDVQGICKVELDAGVVPQHLEADRVLSADKLLCRIDADIKMIEKQIGIGAIWPVGSSQEVGLRRFVLTAQASARTRVEQFELKSERPRRLRLP